MNSQILNVVAIIVLVTAFIVLGSNLKIVHLILFGSGLLFFGLRFIKNKRHE